MSGVRGCEDAMARFECVSGGVAWSLRVRLGTGASRTACIVKTFQELGERSVAIGRD
jgi:hypothetical protein